MSNKALTEPGVEKTPAEEQTTPSCLSRRLGSMTELSIRREQIFEILSNERRRFVLYYLRRHSDEGPISFRELVDQVAAWENETTTDQLGSSDRKCVYTALRQTHLPKLDTFGVIEYDRQRGSIEPKECLDDVLLYMKYVPEREILWRRLYLVLAALCGLTALLIWGGIVPLADVPKMIVAVGTATAFGAFSIAQIYLSYRDGLQIDESGRY